MDSRKLRAGIMVLGAVLVYLFVASPGYRLWRAEHALKAQVAAVKVDLIQKHDTAILRDMPALLGSLTAAHDALGRLAYVGWVPGIGSKFRTDASTVNGIYWLAVGIESLHPVGSGDIPHNLSSLIGGTLGNWNAMGHGLLAALPAFRRASSNIAQIRSGLLPQSLKPVGRDLGKLEPELNGVIRVGPTIAKHPREWAALLGLTKPARYLVLFQNSGELRASGGFITAFGTVTVHNGHIGQLNPIDTAGYNVHSTIPAPFPFRHYFGQETLSFENASANPDVPEVAQTVYAMLRHAHALPPVDGMVFVNTGLVNRLLALEGPLSLSASETHGAPITLTTSNANVEMEYVAERSGLPNAARKQFLGMVMTQLLHRAMQARGTELLGILRGLGLALSNKSIIFYLNTTSAQETLTRLGWTGSIPRHVRGDYLQVVDENLGGHKDNFFLQEAVKTAIHKQGHHTTETTTITWTMPVIANGWLTVGYPGWVEVYVPKGSRLISMTGAGTHFDRTYVATGVQKTVFAGTFYVPTKRLHSRVPVVRRLVVRYILPARVNGSRLLVQLQPGVPIQGLTVVQGSRTRSVQQTRDMVFTN